MNSLRKHPNWGNRAFDLVARWKDVALAETAQIAADESDKQEKTTESGRSDECNNSMDEEDNIYRRKFKLKLLINYSFFEGKNNKKSKQNLLETNKQKVFIFLLILLILNLFSVHQNHPKIIAMNQSTLFPHN